MKLRKIIAMLTATAMAAAALTGCGGSKEYPSQNISVICPYSAGGTTDLCVRGMTESIPDGVLPSGVNITVNNVTGGAGCWREPVPEFLLGWIYARYRKL